MTAQVSPSASRGWTLLELRRAMWLGYGGRSPDQPALSAVAAELRVTPRTVRRWVTGTSRPKPLRADMIRAALAPPAVILRRERMDLSNAVAAARELSRSRPRAASRQWRANNWHQPHLLWLMHQERLGIVRVMLTLASPTHPSEIPVGWVLVDRVNVVSRPAGTIAKQHVLDSVAPWRIRIREGLVDDGRHECWLDTAPDVALSDLASEGPVPVGLTARGVGGARRPRA